MIVAKRSRFSLCEIVDIIFAIKKTNSLKHFKWCANSWVLLNHYVGQTTTIICRFVHMSAHEHAWLWLCCVQVRGKLPLLQEVSWLCWKRFRTPLTWKFIRIWSPGSSKWVPTHRVSHTQKNKEITTHWETSPGHTGLPSSSQSPPHNWVCICQFFTFQCSYRNFLYRS